MSSTTNQRRDQAQDQLEKAREAASTAGDRMKDAASHAGQAAGNVAAAIGQKADDAAAAAGSGMQSLGEKVREKGPEQGPLGKASHAVAGALEQSGKYLEEKKLSGVAEDVTGLIKRNPIPALLIGVGIGFMLGSMLRR